MFTQDFILNGQGHGEFAELFQGVRFDPGMLRPYFDERGRKCVTINTGRREFNPKTNRHEPVFEQYTVNELGGQGIDVPVANATSLRKDEWVELDRVVLKAARQRLRAWTDLASANTYGGFNGMGRTVLEHETMSDPGEAIVDMDGLTEGRTDSPKFQLEGLPLPITHSNFWFSSRRLAISRNTGTPLDTTMAEACGRRVAEKIEKTLIGIDTGLADMQDSRYGRTSQVYGYRNFPDRLTKTDLTTPTGSNASATIDDVIEMRELAYAQGYYGPFMLYTSTAWDRFLDQDYILTGGNVATQTLRERLKAIEGITDVRRLDYLDATYGYEMILVQMTPEVARAVNGMDLTTIQWETMGGMKVHFKVMSIMVPQLRADINGATGLVHATTA